MCIHVNGARRSSSSRSGGLESDFENVNSEMKRHFQTAVDGLYSHSRSGQAWARPSRVTSPAQGHQDTRARTRSALLTRYPLCIHFKSHYRRCGDAGLEGGAALYEVNEEVPHFKL
ncbi:hypothetical protein EVAR_50183_1 [Eumeta japonica]|uniref:Uncharacterized protein n=1 Tax=Eumeta variegata TaxID=151549 RepID=A0A4C1X0A8_EUMVA|nr:hypothetical protein EVAR_50183_1 [Eumeta japonica]